MRLDQCPAHHILLEDQHIFRQKARPKLVILILRIREERKERESLVPLLKSLEHLINFVASAPRKGE